METPTVKCVSEQRDFSEMLLDLDLAVRGPPEGGGEKGVSEKQGADGEGDDKKVREVVHLSMPRQSFMLKVTFDRQCYCELIRWNLDFFPPQNHDFWHHN